MKNKWRDAVLIVGIVFGVSSLSYADITIYEHSFSGSGSSSLNGIELDVTRGELGGTTNAAWSAIKVNADGSKTAGGGYFDNGGAVVPFTPQAGTIYQLSVTTDVTGATDTSDWLAIGFATSGAVNATGLPFNNMRAWLLDRYGDQHENVALVGLSSAGLQDVGAMPLGALNLSIILDASDSDVTKWSAEWLINGGVVRSDTLLGMTSNDISHIKLQGYEHATGTWDDFSLKVIPEPSVIALLGVFSGGLLFVRRVFI